MGLGMFILRETKHWSVPYALDQDISGKQGDSRSSSAGFWRFSPTDVVWRSSVLKCINMQKKYSSHQHSPFLPSFCLVDALVAKALCNMARSHGERC